jgi:DMSO/TMAO reductase YedYZ molybdopterin-dependent catalytic subunit
MTSRALSRRDLLRGSVALAAYGLASRPLTAFGLEPAAGEVLIPWLDVQPKGRAMLYWQDLTSWVTPNESIYEVSHYGKPKVDLAQWHLDLTGFVRKPRSYTLADLQKLPRRDIHATLECGGNGAGIGFMGAIGNVKWTGTPLAPILREAGLLKRAREVVFYGADEKTEKIRDQEVLQRFARSLTVEHAQQSEVMLAWAMNDQPLNDVHGAPVRLIVPGWFGIAWVKWLTRIDLIDRRFMGKWMAREYVTLRGEERPDGSTNWRETSVCNINVKSIAARAVRLPNQSVRITGAAWSDGTPLKSVEVRIDDGPWQPVRLVRKPSAAKYTWTLWQFDWANPTPGEHTVVSRAVDADGREQPPADSPLIKNKKTYWEANQQWPRRIRIAG